MPKLTRRAVIGGMIAAPVVAHAALASAAAEGEYDLQFRLSEDQSTLRVSEVQIAPPRVDGEAPSSEENEPTPVHWDIRASAFGPSAYFDMKQPGEAHERTVYIRHAQYGRRFASDKPGMVGFEFTRPEGRWRIAYVTNLWVSQVPGWTNPVKSSKSVAFDRFVNGEASAAVAPYEDVPADRVDKTLRAIFDDLIQAGPSSAEEFVVALDRNLVWTLTARGAARLYAFDMQIAITKLGLSWRRGTDCGDGADGATYLSGEAAGTDIALEESSGLLSLGPSDGHAVRMRPKPGAIARFDAVLGTGPSLPGESQATCLLSVESAGVVVADAKGVIADGLAGTTLSLAQTAMPGSGVVRTTIWGLANGAGTPVTSQIGGKRAERGRGDILTPVGLLRVDALVAKTPSEEGVQCRTDNELARLFQMSNGDRGGSPEATLYALHDRPAAGGPGVLRRLHIDLALLGTNAALIDTSYSKLVFKRADLRLVFEDGTPIEELPGGEHPRPIASSFVWLGPAVSSAVRARFDLSQALLTCARDYDLMKLRFRFHDLLLSYEDRPVIRPAREDARVWVGDDGGVQDHRPILVAEFDPQHVMEEAIFRPEPPPLPDVELRKAVTLQVAGAAIEVRTREQILTALASATASERKVARSLIRTAKQNQEAAADGPFARMAAAFGTSSGRLPADQRDYIGPFALDPDGMGLARRIMQSVGPDSIRSEIGAMLTRVSTLGASEGSLNVNGRLVDPKAQTDKAAFGLALRNEAIFESLEPFYAVFRAYWRDSVVRFTTARRQGTANNDLLRQVGMAMPGGLDMEDEGNRFLVEFLSETSRFPEYDPNDLVGTMTEAMVEGFITFALGQEPGGVPDVMGARLSGRSRLAFRLDLEAGPGIDAHDAGTERTSGAGPANPGASSSKFRPMEFTFEALTDWSHFEAAVARRARKLFETAPSGILPVLGARSSNSSDQAMMRFQGFSEGAITSDERLAEVRASLRSERLPHLSDGDVQPFAGEPLDFETAIEIPSRLILSTAQDAIWRTNRRMPPQVYGSNAENAPDYAEPVTPTLEEGEGLAGPRAPSQRPRDLWSVRLETAKETAPSLRAISSPDLRPGALVAQRTDLTRSENEKPGEEERLPGQGAPPRGPYAPWFIGPEQLESQTVEAADCPEPPPADHTPFLRWLCDRALFRRTLPARNYAMFRTALDAFDRHQLVLLTSTYGLPVTGKRLPSQDDPDNVDSGGPLIAQSGQIEPGKSFSLIDGTADQALHSPVPFDVKALSLTALGGSFLHDTAFNPSAGADDWKGRKIFEGFSIEKLQQDIVLGRDIRTEVVYKGYLLPLGHKASFVKLTERVFLRTPTQGIKAMLRQRMFLRSADREKLYGAMGQPHGGRMWSGKRVRLMAERTPDLLDPNWDPPLEADGERREGLNGKIDLGGGPGLAFWPRTDITEKGLYRFEVTIDGTPTALPMLFVDNIAATTARSLKAAADTYNDTLNAARRTLQVAGKKIDYVPNSRSGEAQFETEQLHIRVHGRSRSPQAETWTGTLEAEENYVTTGVLEGANQPPFYPAVEYATIRIGAMERMSGGAAAPIDVQYDGHYVLHGFEGDPPPRGITPPVGPAANKAEVFLNLRTATSLGMGGNGDRSGGIARPASHIVAISRSRGPLGGDGATWAALARSALKSDTGLNADPHRPSQQFFDRVRDAKHLASLAPYFNDGVIRPNLPAEQLPPDVIDPIQLAPSEPAPKGAELEILRQVQSYFSMDAKLLGTIKLKVLMRLLGLELDDVPVLKEVREFGSAALRGADGLSNDVRSRVLMPLNDVVVLLRAQWQSLSDELAERQIVLPTFDGKKVEPLRLAQIYPEIDASLGSLERALATALATEEAATLVPALALVHATASELIRALSILAANPVERLDAAVTGNLRERIEALTSAVDQFKDITRALRGLRDAFADQAADAITNWIFEGLGRDAPAGPTAANDAALRFLSLSILPPNLGTIVRKLVIGVTGAEERFRTAVIRIGDKLESDLLAASRRHVRSGLRAAISTALRGEPIEQILTKTLAAYLGAVQLQLTAAIGDAERALDEAATDANGHLDAARDGIRLALEAYRAGIEELVLQVAVEKIDEFSAEFQPLIASIEQIGTAIAHGKALADAVESGDPRTILNKAADFGSDVFGVELADAEVQLQTRLVSAASEGIADLLALLIPQVPATPEPGSPSILMQELAALSTLRSDPSLPGPLPVRLVLGSTPKIFASNDLLLLIGEALLPLVELFPEGAKGPLREAREEIADNADEINAANEAGIIEFTAARLQKFLTDLEELIRDKARPEDCLIADLRSIYGEIVAGVVAAEELKALVSNADGLALEDLDNATAMFARQVRARCERLGGLIDGVLKRLGAFLSAEGNARIIGTAGLLSGAISALQSFFPISQELMAIKRKLDLAEASLTKAMVGVADFALKLVGTSAIGLQSAVGELETTLESLGTLADDTGLTLDPEQDDAVRALVALRAHLGSFAGLKVDPIPTTLGALPGAKTAQGTLEQLFKRAGDDSRFFEAQAKLRALDAAAIRQLRVLQRRIEGLPEDLKRWGEQQLAQSRVFEVLERGYADMTTRRNDVIAQAQGVPILEGFIQRGLLVQPLASLADAGQDVSQCDVTMLPAADAANCDRLWQERAILQAAQKGELLPVEKQRALRRRVVALLQAWASGQAAPLMIVAQVGEIGKDILRGDVLAAIDFSAFRDQIEDAITALIPTKVNFSYDFGSVVTKKSDDRAIFQPKVGSPFGIDLRASLDLLTQKSDFSATAHIGPFDIFLIGDLVDALRLKFGGAAFSVRSNAGSRFDVIYEDFEIGKDLEFAKQLQSYLAPKEGSGVFVQPMTRGAGIEAGYSLYLGTIGVGATSFFNVSLNVSAELPFGDQESLFKISLGRRLAPFSMGVLPFVGSGYFSIYAAADGVRGFEASFEYGGGGAIGYGPLSAECRIQVGVFVRVLKADDKPSTTEIYGTFFAGGSASIWIFHFATSLYVRLGTAEDGAMYGEAIYSFSFSLGIADYDYSITATKKENAIGNKKQGASPTANFRSKRPPVGQAAYRPRLAANGHGGSITVDATDQTENWPDYAQYFDVDLIRNLVP